MTETSMVLEMDDISPKSYANVGRYRGGTKCARACKRFASARNKKVGEWHSRRYIDGRRPRGTGLMIVFAGIGILPFRAGMAGAVRTA